jgi:hypothetical protein
LSVSARRLKKLDKFGTVGSRTAIAYFRAPAQNNEGKGVPAMAYAAIDLKQQAHELIDAMAPGQVSAVVGLLKIMVDPVARGLANAPFDDELVSESETNAAAISREWLEHHEPVPNEEVLADFGLTSEDFERLGRTPLVTSAPGR